MDLTWRLVCVACGRTVASDTTCYPQRYSPSGCLFLSPFPCDAPVSSHSLRSLFGIQLTKNICENDIRRTLMPCYVWEPFQTLSVQLEPPPQQPLPSIPSLLRLSWAFSPSSSSSHALPSPIWHLTVSSEPSCSRPSLPTGCMCTRPGTRMDIVPLLSAHACLYHDTHVLSTSPYTPKSRCPVPPQVPPPRPSLSIHSRAAPPTLVLPSISK